MKRFINWILILGACVAAFYLIGLIVPRTQTAGSKTNMVATPRVVLELIQDPQYWPEWHPDFAKVQERGERNDHPIWAVTDRMARSFELEVLGSDERMWQGTYELDGTRFTLRFEVLGYGQGARVQITRSSDTRDPWLRARRFLWSKPEASPIAILNGISAYLGESPEAVAR